MKKFSYRSDIDGLRALAVVAVIANHLPGKYLPSGYLGVDVFFVISGFVVTASLLAFDRTGFSGFYAKFLSRRVKRLLPALIACVGATSLIVLIADPFPRHSIVTGIAALFGVANIALFNFELDYFAPSSSFNAFTHTWSLGVEEQFYVIFPLIIWLAYSRTGGRSYGVLSTVLLAISLASALLFLWLYEVDQIAAYYMMPTRFWELGAGALVFLASRKPTTARISRAMDYVPIPALLALGLCFLAPLDWAAPVTVLAVCLTGLILFNANQTLCWRLLSLRPVVYIGKISYSLYLWHWPVVALGPMLLSPGWRYSSLYIAAMSLAAVLSYHLVEKPLRGARWSSRNSREIGMGFACSLILGVVIYFALTVSEKTASIYAPANLPLIPSGLPYHPTCVVDDRLWLLAADTFETCTLPARSGSGMPMIWTHGDSHAGHLQGLLYELYNTAGIGVHLVETPGHPFPASNGDEFPPRKILYNRMMENIERGDIVLLSRLLLSRNNPVQAEQDLAPWIAQVAALASELSDKGVVLVVMGPPPIFYFEDIRECDLAARESCSIKRSDLELAVDAVMDQLYELERASDNFLVFDVFKELCPPIDDRCYPDEDGRYLFRDRDHFNSHGSTRLAEPFLAFLHANGVLIEKQ